jgi:exodeoxyribonuclease VII small subunit
MGAGTRHHLRARGVTDETRPGRSVPPVVCALGGREGEMTKESFEEALAQLEEVVAKLEDESVGLEEALKLFERGVKLARRCRSQLEGVERRVEQLLAEATESEEEKTQPFSAEES